MKPEEKRELKIKAAFAALTGLCANPNIVKSLDEHNSFFEAISIECTVYADCLISQLEEEEEEDDN
jgi:hypothetical protein